MRPGDTLSAIATRYGTTVSALVAANGITNPNQIYAGATIQIPDSPPLPRPPTPAAPAPGTPASANTTVVVRRGDTLSSIATPLPHDGGGARLANKISNPNVVFGGSPSLVARTDAASRAGARAGRCPPRSWPTPIGWHSGPPS